MIELNPNSPPELITGIAVCAELAAYFFFRHWGRSLNRNRPPNKFTIGPRMLGCIAVAVTAAWLMRYMQEHLVDNTVFVALSAHEQAEYLWRILRSIILPASIIIGVVAAHAWRDKRAERARTMPPAA